jgi:hypothetical protein
VLSDGSVLSDEGGRAQTVLGAGGDTTPRPITVTASSEGVSESITVSLVNAQLVINGPAEVFVNAITEYTVRLTDDGGNPIAGQVVTLDSVIGNDVDFAERTTNAAGEALFRYVGAEIGQDQLVATGFGETATLDLEIGVDIASIGLFTSTPTLGSDGVDRADITAIVQNSSGQVVPGAQVVISADTGDIAQSDPLTDANGRVDATLGTAGDRTNRTIRGSNCLVRPTSWPMPRSSMSRACSIPETTGSPDSPSNLSRRRATRFLRTPSLPTAPASPG